MTNVPSQWPPRSLSRGIISYQATVELHKRRSIRHWNGSSGWSSEASRQPLPLLIGLGHEVASCGAARSAVMSRMVLKLRICGIGNDQRPRYVGLENG